MEGFVVGGTGSGVGKTVATLAISHALGTEGREVQPAKAGPDFIDPTHHEAVAGRPSRTLDTWLQGTDGLRRNYDRGEGDVCVVEGMMGLYDGDVTSTATVADGLPVLGECGGLMALAETLTTADGETHAMAGVLPADVRMHDRYRALDHVELRARRGTLTADAGQQLRGHEFHYSSAEVAADARFAFDVQRGTGIDGGRDGLTEYGTLGTYCHVHPGSGAFDAFVRSL